MEPTLPSESLSGESGVISAVEFKRVDFAVFAPGDNLQYQTTTNIHTEEEHFLSLNPVGPTIYISSLFSLT